MRKAVIEDYLPLETNGDSIVYPFWGTVKRFANVSRVSARVFAVAEVRTLLWIAALFTAAIAAFVSLLAMGFGIPPLWQIAILALVTWIAERQSVRVGNNIETSVAFLPFVFTAVAFGPLAALVVGALANVLDFRRPYLRWAIYVPVRALTGAAAGFVALEIAGSSNRGFAPILLATASAGLANFAFDSVFNIATLVVRRSAAGIVFLRAVGPLVVLSLPLYVPLVALMAYWYRHSSFGLAAMFLVPALAMQRLVRLYQEERVATRGLADANERLERANLSFASALVATLDARDRYTAGHSAAVAIYARDIAERMGLSTEDQRLAHLCGLVHDIGKVGLPPGLLEKAGPLTLDERRKMEEHSPIGERILANVDDYGEIAEVVRHHHERVDGNGYPDGLKKQRIPILSRIIAVADAYDAMTSDRPYRDAMPPQVARLRLAQAVETQFDTAVVAAFEAILAGAPEAYRVGQRTDFVFNAQEHALRVATL